MIKFRGKLDCPIILSNHFNKRLLVLLFSTSIKIRIHLVIGLCTLLFLAVNGQSLPGAEEPELSELKNKTLVVVIPSYRKKLKVLSGLRSSQNYSRRIEKDYQRTLAEQQVFQRELISAFESGYGFSDFVFVIDSAMAGLAEPTLIGFKEDQDSIEIEREETWFLMKSNVENGAEALILHDHNLDQLHKPIPYYYKLNSLGGVLEAFFSSTGRKWRSLEQLVVRMDEKLISHWTKKKR